MYFSLIASKKTIYSFQVWLKATRILPREINEVVIVFNFSFHIWYFFIDNDVDSYDNQFDTKKPLVDEVESDQNDSNTEQDDDFVDQESEHQQDYQDHNESESESYDDYPDQSEKAFEDEKDSSRNLQRESTDDRSEDVSQHSFQGSPRELPKNEPEIGNIEQRCQITNKVIIKLERFLCHTKKSQTWFRKGEEIYKNRIRVDNKLMESMQDPDDIRSACYYLLDRYCEVQRYSIDQEHDILEQLNAIERLEEEILEDKRLTLIYNMLSQMDKLKGEFRPRERLRRKIIGDNKRHIEFIADVNMYWKDVISSWSINSLKSAYILVNKMKSWTNVWKLSD